MKGDGIGAALALCRFLGDVALLGLWGASAYLAGLVPTGLAVRVARRLTGVWIAAVALAVVALLARLPTEAAGVGSGWSDAAEPAMLASVLMDTSIGRSWAVVAFGAAVLVAACLLAPRWRLPVTAVGAGIAIIGLTLTGHANGQDGPLGWVHRFNDAVHLLSAGAWIGALAPLLPILQALRTPGLRQDATLALRRFSTAGHGAVALILLTGAVNTALVLGRWPTDWASPYQALLAAKIGTVAIIVLLALLNRYVFVRRLRASPDAAIEAIRRVTMAEIGLGLLVLALVAVFGILEPA